MTNNDSIGKPELLAPAGDFISLQAAIQSGCDAVYFGVAGFNMRCGASNFQIGDMQEIGRRCRRANVKCYLTLNTIIYPGERGGVEEILDGAKGWVDAVICWDPAVIYGCRKRNLPIHISTQASVSNAVSALFYKDLGATRIVPARECTLNELISIKEETSMELEVFAHGAMCVSVSGRCYISELTHGKSGNRGECQQNCRREYEVKDLQAGHEFTLGNHYVMSAKDVCTLPFIEMLCAAGIDALKIEGRGRNPDYVRTVVASYRTAIDAWAAGSLTLAMKSRLVDEVKTVYNRTFSSGFYFGRPITEFNDAYGGNATVRKEYVGIVTNYFRKAQVLEIQVLDNTFEVGARLTVQGTTTGVVNFSPSEIRQHEEVVHQAERGIVTTPLTDRVRIGDKVYRLVERNPEALHRR